MNLSKVIGIFLATGTAFLGVGLRAEEAPYTLSAEIKEERRLLANTARQAVKKPAVSCVDIKGKLSRAGGGCKLASNNIIYGPNEWVGNRLRLEVWTTRSGAVQRCASSGRGGFYNWRLPTAEEVLAAATYLNAMGIDPYLYTWSSEAWISVETQVLALERPDFFRSAVVETKPEILGYNQSSDRYPFDPALYAHATPVVGQRVTSVADEGHVVRGEFDFVVQHMLLVRAVIGGSLDLKRYTPGEVRGTLSWRQRQTISRPTATSESYDLYLGQSYGTRVSETGQQTVTSDLGTTAKDVDPCSYGLEAPNPQDVTADQIGLFCVRDDDGSEPALPADR